ncbi:MAG: ATP-binding protein, partial [Candidatus Hydrogenedentes bacterium]|nr:ATP-binding protein [Candidatus Hydrogenedentota bacterium]
GTNGEIVLGNSDWLVTASCSAGPAFEGGGIEHGMRAARGAIERIRINPSTCEPMIITRGNAKPRGICGSGLINIVAELLEAGIIGQNGKFNTDTRCSSKRVREVDGTYGYVICWADESQTGSDIVITEPDIDNLIRAKGAMYAGYQTLLESVEMTPEDLDRVIIAGAFGDYIDLDGAMTIGLLPELSEDKFMFIGNGSLLGARLVSFSNEMLDDAERIARMMTNFELSENPAFMDKYVAALFLPHTDADAFPEVTERLGLLKRNCDSGEPSKP